MYRLHLARNLRSFAFLLGIAAAVSMVVVLWWANRTGLPESWRTAIEREISRQGAHVKIGSLSLHPLRGVVASKIRVFSDPLFRHEISRLERVVLDFDKTRLARGNVHITKIELKDATLQLPVDPADPASELLEIRNANGTVLIPGGRRIEIRNASGRISGIDVSLSARLIGYQQEGAGQQEPARTGERRKLIARIIAELRKWRFAPDTPPRLAFTLEGDANQPSSLTARLSLLAKGVEKNRHVIDEIAAEAELTGDLLSISSIHARDSRGSLDGGADYDMKERSGRFDLRSSLELQPLLTAWLGIPPPPGILVGGSQQIDAGGEFRLDEKNQPHIHMTGSLQAGSVLLKGVRFDTISSDFAWRDGDLFLRGLRLSRPEGEATGKAMIQWPLVRLAVESTLPEQLLKPFFKGQPLEIVIGDFSDRKGARVHVRIEGGFDATDRYSWAYTGSGTVENVSYKGVPVDHAHCSFSLSHHELDFYDGTVVFNYRNYPLRKAFDGPAQGTAKVGRIRYDGPSKTVEVGNVTGKIWAAPLVRLFAPAVADSLEAYRFHQPPDLLGSGVVDVTPAGRTSLDVSFKSDAAADYRFLGENLTLGRPAGMVAIRGPRVRIRDLTLDAFDGPVAADFDFSGTGRLDGEISWTKLSVPGLSSTYGFNMKGGGRLTGRLEFDLTGGKVETMNGEGLFALEKTELFSVPVFGPLSPVISGVLGDRQAGFERAKSAFCTFRIKEGILATRDFRTATPSLVFAGDGSVNLKERTLDMTMRLNARGLLGLITLPLRPFYGMFQFRGSGPLNDTKWENVMFTAPPADQQEILRATPRATVVPDQR